MAFALKLEGERTPCSFWVLQNKDRDFDTLDAYTVWTRNKYVDSAFNPFREYDRLVMTFDLNVLPFFCFQVTR